MGRCKITRYDANLVAHRLNKELNFVPAFGQIDGYGPSLHVSPQQAIRMWGHPTTSDDISEIFKRHISGNLEAVPWSEEDFLPETSAITEPLLRLNAKGWWTIASQPAVNGVKSTDTKFGWGPKGGFCFQKVLAACVRIVTAHTD